MVVQSKVLRTKDCIAKHVMGDEGQTMLNRFAQPKRLDGVM